MDTAIATPPSRIAQFKVDVDSLMEQHQYFNERILPTLVEGQDYYVIKGRKSCSKQGAEKLAGIYNLVATFEYDEATVKSFPQTEGLIAYVCTLRRPDGSIAGQGRGSSLVTANNTDINRGIKISQKSSFIDAVLRTTGLSRVFTQDLETMPVESIRTSGLTQDNNAEERPGEMITAKQKNFLQNLACENIYDEAEREKFLSSLDEMTKFDASESISSFLMAKTR